jgi:hypothetical protein
MRATCERCGLQIKPGVTFRRTADGGAQHTAWCPRITAPGEHPTPPDLNLTLRPPPPTAA